MNIMYTYNVKHTNNTQRDKGKAATSFQFYLEAEIIVRP